MAHYFLAKLAVSACFALIIVALLLLAAFTAAGVRLSGEHIARLVLVLGFGSLPFAALGMCAGAWLKGQSAPGILNGLYLPSAALSGLWFPLFLLPPWIQNLAILLPPYHLGQLAQAALGRSDGQALQHVAALLLTTMLALWLAARGLRRNPF